jgi:dipeptide/oligopeptide/ni2+ ABC superfamily ATP binding cassette transporter, binding protein
MDQTLRSTSPENVGHYANPEVDKLLDAMVTAADAKQRMELAGKIQDLVLQDVPNLYLVCPTNQVVAQSNVKGVVVHPIDYYLITKDLTVDGK